MASVAKNVKLYLDGYDLSGDFNAAAFRTGVDAEEATTFGAGARVHKAGLPTNRVEAAGLWRSDTDVLDAVLQARLGIDDGVLLASPESGADGESSYLMLASQGEYRPQSEVGRIVTFDLSLFATDRPLVRGTIMGTGSKAATGNGTVRQLGAVSATQKLYAVLQVFSGTGTLDVIVESDSVVGFTGATTRVTFAQQTGRAAVYATPIDGAITDEYWRVSWTIGTGPFVLAVGVGIF